MDEAHLYHSPVLLHESVQGLCMDPEGVYVDVTFGGGGHSRLMLKKLGENGRLIAFDQDEEALGNAIVDDRFRLINQNFRYLKRYLKFYGITKVDGILADLGVSSHQFDQADRGFSVRFDGKLDMRMSQTNTSSALKVINTYKVEDLTFIFKEYGELRMAYKLAKKIEQSRQEKRIETTLELNDVVRSFMPKGKENRFLAQLYQALRIEVNQELEVLKELLEQMGEVVKVGGRVAIISYHSLEDRLVKRFIREGRFDGEGEKDFYGNKMVPFKKVGGMIVPSDDEIEKNNRARSAKLRIAERV